MGLDRLRDINIDAIMQSVNSFVRQIKNIEEVETVILFGSLAKGKMTSASDIDLAVLYSETQDLKGLKNSIRNLKRQNISWPCDLVIVENSIFDQKRKIGGICMEIDATGKILYSKNSEES